ncbi:hypothetical protein ABZ479_34575 [Streptomyces sp. NPDC005722]
MSLPAAQHAAVFQRGADLLGSFVARLEPGEHLFKCWLDSDGESRLEWAQVTVTGSSSGDLVEMDDEQMDVVAMLLGAGLDPRAEYCGVELCSVVLGAVSAVVRAWDVEYGYRAGEVPWMRPLSAAETRSYRENTIGITGGETFAAAFWPEGEPDEDAEADSTLHPQG